MLRNTYQHLITICLLGVMLTMIISPKRSALAQQLPDIKIEQMEISIWPEYDDPRVLAMYKGRVNGDVTFPTQVKFFVPKGAEVTQTCGLTEAGEHLCQLPQFTPKTKYTEVSYSLPTERFLVEMYYDAFSASPGQTRDFDFTFLAPYPVEKLNVTVQEPLRSREFNLTPTATNVQSDSQGFRYHYLNFGNVAMGKEISINVAYTKPDRRPSIMKKTRRGGSTSSSSKSNTVVMIVILMAVLISGVIGAYWFVSSKQNAKPTKPVLSKSSGTSPDSPHPTKRNRPRRGAKTGATRFCPNCGNQVLSEDKFCSNCGKELRRG